MGSGMAQSQQGLTPHVSESDAPPVAVGEGASPDVRPEPDDFVRLLQAARAGDRTSFDAAFAEVYDELHALAARVRAAGASDTLNATALVHEAYLKLVPSADRGWVSREHFFAVAARAMRQVLIGAARQRLASKRDGLAVNLDEAANVAPLRPAELLALDEALDRLAAISERQARVV
jgi:RNA polymerase sigma factor (TIGR02999 family)